MLSLYDEIGRRARLKTLSHTGFWFKSRYRYILMFQALLLISLSLCKRIRYLLAIASIILFSITLLELVNCYVLVEQPLAVNNLFFNSWVLHYIFIYYLIFVFIIFIMKLIRNLWHLWHFRKYDLFYTFSRSATVFC